MKKGPFKLKSGNKPSMAQLSGVSPVKKITGNVNAFKEANKALKERSKVKRNERENSGEPSKLTTDVKRVGSRVDKFLQRLFNNPRNKAAGGDQETYKAPDKGIASVVSNDSSNGGGNGGSNGGSNGGFKPVTFKGKKGDGYTYRTLEGGGFEFMRPENDFYEPATKKGNEAISKIAPAKMKKSPAKLVKKKTEREKLNKLVKKRTKLKDKKTKREGKEKNTKRVDKKIEKNQAKINANPKAKQDKAKADAAKAKTKKSKKDLFEKMTPTRIKAVPTAKKKTDQTRRERGN